ncbi:hypothetical protein DXG01_004504 [Tephrocybe rancida]|nr:hypothetical protein DXG01_004504 [Tephrocybe rancida]
MRLYINGKTAWNSTFSAENGDAVYVAQSPKRIFGRTTNIDRVAPDLGYPSGSNEACHIAQFAWKTFFSARLRIHNKEVRTRSFFKKKGWHLHGRDRVFEIEGCKYRWMLGTGVPELRLHDKCKTLVARYHPRVHGKPFLEILPGWKGIADDIVVSFIYIEKLVEDD